MCRIAGCISKLPGTELLHKTNEMLLSLAHGGPDDRGIFSSPDSRIAIGHRRLSIIDLSPLGHQPMFSADKSVVISYNGEIYNFKEIRDELIQKGYVFVSNSDTEVIIQAYKEWGTASFARLNGMFAFCLYDQSRQKIFLVRDPSGIKPLYYFVNDRKLVFASEIRVFKKYDPSWEPHPQWKIYFLLFSFIPHPYTTLKDVFSLTKGHYLELDPGSFQHSIRPYRHTFFSHSITNEEEAKQKIRLTFQQAVSRHLISDAPIGVFLSGGIDSSLIALLASTTGHEKLNTLSVVFKEASFSEKPYQQLVLNKIKTEHTECEVDERFFIDHLEDVFAAKDQPSIDGINTYFISKCAKDRGLKAVLSGLGADEYFGGYPSFQRMGMIEKLKRLPGLALRTAEHLHYKNLDRISFLTFPDPIGSYLFLRGIYSVAEVSGILGCSYSEVAEAIHRLAAITPVEQIPETEKACFLESNWFMLNQLLKDSDYMSMWHSLEIRVPFLDKELLELMRDIRPSIKYRPSSPKWLLTETFNDLLPYEVVNRPKQGFTFPFDLWLRNNPGLIWQHADSSNQVIKQSLKKFEKKELHWSKMMGLMVLGKS